MIKCIFTILILFIFVSINYAQWTEQTSGVTTSLNSVSAVDSNNVWICGDGGKVLITGNSGVTWNTANSPNPVLNLTCIWGLDENNALAAGSSNSAAYVYKTTNRGANWTQVYSQPNGFFRNLTKIMINPNQYICLLIGDPVGGRWSVWSSSNDGGSWDSTGGIYFIQQGSEAGYCNSYFMNYHEWNSHSHFYWGSNASHVYYGQGQTWGYSTTQNLAGICSIYFSDDIHGFAGGSGGTGFNVTSDGGLTWISAPFQGTGICYGITGANQEIWYCRGASGSSGIYYSSNGGTLFSPDYTAPNGYFNHMTKARNGIIDLGQNGNIWAIRNNGGISRKGSPIGIKNISSEIPAEFRIEQNYPNPFNPATKIKFEIPKTANVNARILDITGREVSVLVNGMIQPGVYEVTWNGDNFSSGIYFFEFNAGDFRDVKKMVLLK